MLKLLPEAFVTEDGHSVAQIDISQVEAHRAGLAYGTLDDAAPFLREDRSISLDGLGILTTTRIPPERLGLLPATHMRIPALFGPTEEPLLLDGTLLNLGDKTISRKHDMVTAPIAEFPTSTLKLMLFQDETPIDWQVLQQSPLRTLMQHFPTLMLCRGDRCGDSCGKFHAPVDQELDTVLLDVWARTWLSVRGRKVPQDQSDLFQVFVRVPTVCQLPLLRLSGRNGFYAEPRQTDGKGADQGTTVIWVPQGDLPTTLHKAKTVEKALGIARYGHKYGFRVLLKDAESAHQAICPSAPFLNIGVEKVWEIRPLPHGTQKNALLAMLRSWSWKAKPLQPCRADSAGMGWMVGSTDNPPSQILLTDKGEVTVSLHQKQLEKVDEHAVWSSSKTKALLRRSIKPQQTGGQKSFAAGGNSSKEDSWVHGDPWSIFKPITRPTGDHDTPMQTVSMIDQVEGRRIRDQIASSSAADPRIARLETDVHEIRQQNSKFEQWFQEAGQSSAAMKGTTDDLVQQVTHHEAAVQQIHTQVAQTTHRVEQVSSQVVANRDELASLDTKITNGFASLEGLLSKRSRAE